LQNKKLNNKNRYFLTNLKGETMKLKKMTRKSIINLIDNVKTKNKVKKTTFTKEMYPLWEEVKWYFKGKPINRGHKKYTK